MSPAEVDALVAKMLDDHSRGLLEQARMLREQADKLEALAARPAALPVGEAERRDEAATWRQAATYMRNNQQYFDEGEDAKAEFLRSADDFERFAVEAERAALASPAPQPAAPAPVAVPEHVRKHSREIVAMYRGLLPSEKVSKGTLAAMAIGLLERWLAVAPAPVEPPPASPRLRGGGIISHAEIEDARKAQE